MSHEPADFRQVLSVTELAQRPVVRSQMTCLPHTECLGITRHGEIDLVCRDREVWVFVEVKCRQARWDDGPGAAVSWWKRRRLIRLAQHYLKWMHLTDARCRFDVVAVTPRHDGRFEIRHIPAAFDASGLV